VRVAMTQSREMALTRWEVFTCVLLTCIPCGWPQSTPQKESDEPLAVFTEHPRLLLRPQRLRLLKRERERTSMRWQQFENLVAGKAPMPEPGFALALYYQVSGDRNAGRQAVEWALAPGSDLRQVAMVFDWCQDILDPAESKALIARIEKSLAQPSAYGSVAAVRDRVFGAIALADHVPDAPSRELEAVVRQWWKKQVLPALESGKEVIARDSYLALFEILHAFRDNLNVDLRESAPRYFKGLPAFHLVSHYPASYPAPESEYRIPMTKGAREPDLLEAVRSRAAGFAMVAYDVNAGESQVLQGWLMHDNFMMRGTWGAPYELLWANPYLPGLSYFLAPMVYYDETFGRLFARSSWDDDAVWFGCLDGDMQIFREGRQIPITREADPQPLSIATAQIAFGFKARQFKITLEEGQAFFIVGLPSNTVFELEADDEEMREVGTDHGGTLPLILPHGTAIQFRLCEPRRTG